MPRKIILDCDPGHDDAMAMLLAHANPAIELLAVTTVAGNQTLEKTTLNARRVMTAAGMLNVPLAAGADRPLVREQLVAGDIHGESGLDGTPFPEPTVEVEPRHAVDLIIDLVMQHDDITLVPTGPLTNIALAMRQEPRILPRIKEIVLMGGAISAGNRTPAAEFNIFADPEAADVVFRSGVPIVMMSLDLTHQVKAVPEVLRRVRAVGTPMATMAADLLTFYGATYKKVYGFEGAPVHDATCVAYLIQPELFECQHVNVVIEIKGTYTYGRTVCDMLGRTGWPKNALVATKINPAGFWDLMTEALASYRTN